MSKNAMSVTTVKLSATCANEHVVKILTESAYI